ncbi:PPE family protein [Mycolicibacterium goodii]|nr:PPE family protein [Mycolicibacterium goodii]
MLGPPEIITSTLQTGPGAGPMIAAGGAWTTHAIELGTQAADYSRIVASGSGRWTSPAGMKMVASAAKMSAYLTIAATLAGKAASQAAAQAAAYQTAFFGVPQMPEMAENHTTHAVLQATNFLGINTVPIALNEADYLVRMTGQAHATMASYGTETMSNLAALPAFSLPQPMTLPGVGLDALTSSGFLAVTGLPQKITRDAIFSAVGTESMFSTATQQGGRLAATVGEGEQKARNLATTVGMGTQQASQQSAANGTENTQQFTQALTSAPQMVSQLPSQVGQFGSQLTQGPQGMAGQFQQFLSPFMQMLQSGGGYGVDATGTPVDQLGLLGASPISNHPLLGGTGPVGGGAGLLTGGALPGAGGTSPRTPLLASLSTASTSAPSQSVEPAATVGGAPRAGAAPIGAMPIGAAGAHGQDSGGTVDQLVAPAPLEFDDDLDELDQWPV